jgi:uncharacterized alpha-E superfamily protein
MPLVGIDGASDALPPGIDATADVRHHLSFDSNNPNSVVACIRQARGAAQRVRESISSEMWEQINTLYLSVATPQASVEAERDPIAFYRQVREGAQFLQGLADCTLAHDEPWHFICMGTYLERADNAARLLNLQAYLLSSPTDPADAAVRWLAILRSCGCAEAYARFYALRVEPARVIEFVLLNPLFPQAVLFALTSARNSLHEIARGAGSPSDHPVLRAMGKLCARLENASVDEIIDEGLGRFLRDTRRGIAELADIVTRTYLHDEAEPARGEGLARAAVIMAAQQQQ